MNAGFDLNALAGRPPTSGNQPGQMNMAMAAGGVGAAGANPTMFAANQLNMAAMVQAGHALGGAHMPVHASAGSVGVHGVGHSQAHTMNPHAAAAAAVAHHQTASAGGQAGATNTNAFMQTGLSATAVNNNNALASSVNLASIQSLIDLLHELPLPSETPAQAAKQEVLITPMQQQQHVQSNLHTELMQQHYLTHQLANPLLLAKQQMAEMNLEWSSIPKPATDANGTPTEAAQFSVNHETNAFLLSLVQQKGIFDSSVRLPPISKHFTPTQQHQQATTAQQSETSQPTSSPAQPNLPQTRQTRSQAQPQYWNPFINEQQQATGKQPTARQNNTPYGNDNSNSSSSFSDNSNMISAGLLASGGSVPSTPTHQQPGMSPAMASHIQQHTQHHSNQFVAPTRPDQENGVSRHNQQHVSHVSQATQQNTQLQQTLQQVPSQHQFQQPLAYEQLDPSAFPVEMPNDAYSSMADRIKSKKRSHRQEQNSAEMLLASPNSQPIPPSFTPVPVKAEPQPSAKHVHTKTTNSNHSNHAANNHEQSHALTPTKQKSPKQAPRSLAERRERLAPAPFPPSPPPSTHQLASQNLSVPPMEKFEAMLSELFDVNGGKIKKRKKSDFEEEEMEEDEDDDYYEEGVKRKKKSKKTNGDAMEAPILFDISLSSSTLMHFVGLSAKLKRSNQMKQVPSSKLTNLLTVLTHQLAIQSASLKEKKRDTEEDDDDEHAAHTQNVKSIVEKFELCCDCCLVSLNIMTSKGMCSRIYLEECIEQIISFLNSTIQQYTGIGSTITTSPVKGKGKGKKYTGPSGTTNKKLLNRMYTKWSELIACVAELMAIHRGSLTDTLVLSTTRVALNAFFLESLAGGAGNLSADSNEIQLNALNLTCAIFAQYVNHRQVILEEIIHSISRLSTSKKGRVFYNVDSEEKNTVISMFSALVLKLIQSLYVEQPAKEKIEGENALTVASETAQTLQRVEMLKRNYSEMLVTAAGFIDSFLKKCVGGAGSSSSSGSDADFRVLFDHLVNDLMVVLHKPNWPAAQLLAHVMLTILTSNVLGQTKGRNASSAAGGNLQLRLCSLDHLGTLCSRYAKELSSVNELRDDVRDALRNMMQQGDNVQSCGTPRSKKEEKKEKRRQKQLKELDSFLENSETLQMELWKHLIRYADEERLLEEKDLFVSIWIREMEREVTYKDKERAAAEKSRQEDEDVESKEPSQEASIQDQFETSLKKYMDLYKNASNANANSVEDYHVVDSKTAELIVRYLDITMPNTTRLFDLSLKHVIASLSSTSNTTMRSRAMKSLSTVLNNAPRTYASSLLSRNDLKLAIKNSLMDPSSSVREATIDLIGKFILNCQSEDLIDRYYDIITARILDTGVSVRKRVIKILREICLSYPTYSKIPEICSRIIKRVNDDGEGIRKFVTETFTSMWFKEENSREAVKLKVDCIVHVVSTVVFERIGTEWLQQLLSNLLSTPNDSATSKGMMKAEDDESPMKNASAQQMAQVHSASSQIVDVLVREMLCSGESENRSKTVTVSAMTTLWLFGKVAPKLLVDHISIIQPFLSMRCSTQLDTMILIKVIQIIEHVLPKLANPSEFLLTSIEEELTKLIIQGNATVVGYCVSCLSSLVHKHTQNKTLVKDLFSRFFLILQQLHKRMELTQQPVYKPRISRALFTCGLFAKHFEFIEQKDELFRITIQFIVSNLPSENGFLIEQSHFAEILATIPGILPVENDINAFLDPVKENVDTDLLLNALSGLGFICEGTPSFLLRDDAQCVYKGILKRRFTLKVEVIEEEFEHRSRSKPAKVKSVANEAQFEENTVCAVLKNFTNYLSEQLNSEMSQTIEWSKENLKSMVSDEGDANSEQSAIIQLYLDDVVNCTLSPQLNVRKCAVNLIHIIHSGGIVHPLQLAPYLIAMSSDDELSIRAKADHVLNEIERKYHGFVSMKAKQGVILSYKLHSSSGKRGFRFESNSSSVSIANAGANGGSNTEEKYIIARLSTLYSVVNNNRQSRRAFIVGLLKYFEPPNTNPYAGQLPLAEIEQRQRERIEIQNYICDNIIWLPYSVWDEVLFILREVDHSISKNADQTDSLFKEILHLDDADDDDEEAVNEQKTYERQQRRENAKYQLLSYQAELTLKELCDCLQSFITLSWTKQVLRDLYLVTDAKFQEYSVNEAQKVWDKQLHKKSMDTRQCLKLMEYPSITLSVNKEDLEDSWQSLYSEYKRFKNIHLTGVDSSGKNALQVLKDPMGKPSMPAPIVSNANSFNRSMSMESTGQMDVSEYSSYEGNSMMETSQGQMYGLDSSYMTNQEGATHTGLRLTLPNMAATGSAPPSASKRKKKKKDKKHGKKKKKEKYRSDSDEDDDDMDEEEDDDEDMDPDYC